MTRPSQARWRTTERNISESPSSPLDDSTPDLIRRTHAGDDEAREALYSRYLPRMNRWARGRLPPRARCMLETGDLVQSTLLKSTRCLASFDPGHAGSFPAYLRKAMLNIIRDEARKAYSLPEVAPLDGSEIDPVPSPLDDAVGQDLADRYDQAVRRLTEADQAALFLKVEMGLSYAEIAVALNRSSADAARMATRRAVVRLAKEMNHADRQASGR